MKLIKVFSRTFSIFIAAVMLFVSLPVDIHGWAATTRWPGNYPTHQHVLKQAYRLLEADPAFTGSNFPTLDQILQHEGMAWELGPTMGIFGPNLVDIVGNGPDDETKTDWSEHYYNPETEEGKAPTAVKNYYTALCEAMYGAVESTRPISTAKAAAWSAHFLADMWVPYHVVGSSGDAARNVDYSGKYLLEDKITGPDFLYGAPGSEKEPGNGWGGGDNFAKAVERYVKYFNEGGPQEARDWFDPWYLNGPMLGDFKYLYSSHINWEKNANGAYEKNPYTGAEETDAPAWLNTLPTWDSAILNSASQAEAFTVKAAKTTRKDIEKYWKNPEEGVYAAIESVYTLWRSSISAMQPEVELIPASGNTYQVKSSVFNAADEAVQNVELKLSVTGGALQGENIQTLAFIGAGSTVNQTWTLTASDPQNLTVKIEVIGTYNTTPDLQYAAAETLKPIGIKVTPENPKQGERVTMEVQIDPAQSSELTFIDWGPLEEISEKLKTDIDGTFIKDFTVKDDVYDGYYNITVKSTATGKQGTLRIFVGNQILINILDCTEAKATISVNPTWERSDGTKPQQLFNMGGGGSTPSYMPGTFSGTTYTATWDYKQDQGSMALMPPQHFWGKLTVNFDDTFSKITSFDLTEEWEALEKDRINPVITHTHVTGTNIPLWDKRVNTIYFRVENLQVCQGHSLVIESERINRDGTIDTMKSFTCEPTTGISIMHFEFRIPR